MPRCDGRPGQQCSRSDNTVRFTQGDLWSCADCEEFRFPTVNATSAVATRNTTTKSKPSADTMSGISKSEKVKSKGKSKASKRKATYTGNDSESDTDDLLQNAQCLCCLGVTDSSARATCAICAGMYHVACSGIPDSCLKQFLDLAKHVNWVCENCRVTVNSTVQRLRAEVSMLSESVAQLQSDIAEIKSAQFQSQQDQVITAEPGTLHSLPSANDLPAAVPVVEVERVINNINRRKSNIIVSGLAEVSNVSDTDAFQQLCEDYLECKPFVVSSRRIGQHSTDKPRRLLVRLRDEQSATAILR